MRPFFFLALAELQLLEVDYGLWKRDTGKVRHSAAGYGENFFNYEIVT